jgi:hypothetical protein
MAGVNDISSASSWSLVDLTIVYQEFCISYGGVSPYVSVIYS